jgi:hypothetical protein
MREKGSRRMKRRPRLRRGTWTYEGVFLGNFVKQSNKQCWIWTGPVTDGYGGMPGKLRAHRYSWEYHWGPIPPGMEICHECDTPLCVNPFHLYCGTSSDNRRDYHRRLAPIYRAIKNEWKIALASQELMRTQ